MTPTTASLYGTSLSLPDEHDDLDETDPSSPGLGCGAKAFVLSSSPAVGSF